MNTLTAATIAGLLFGAYLTSRRVPTVYDPDLALVHRELIRQLAAENAALRADNVRTHAHCCDLMHAQAAHTAICTQAQTARLAKFVAAFEARNLAAQHVHT